MADYYCRNKAPRYLGIFGTKLLNMTDKELLTRIGKNIKKIRKEKKIHQYELSDLCRFEKASLSRLENGKTNATALTLLKVSNALGVHISLLFRD